MSFQGFLLCGKRAEKRCKHGTDDRPDRPRLYASRHRIGEAGQGLGEPQSASGGCDRKEWQDHRGGLPRALRGAPCGEERAQEPDGTCKGRGLVCHAGALLPLWEDAAVYSGDLRAGDRAGRDRLQGPESQSGGTGSENIKGCGSAGGGGLYARGMRPPESGIFPLYYGKDPLCGDEIRDDSGWEDRHEDRRVKVGHRQGGKAGGTAYAKRLHGNHGGDRDGACRRPDVKCAASRQESSRADHL